MLEWRRYLESLLGIEPVAAGEDTHWEFRYTLGWPDWALALFVVVALAIIFGTYLRESANASRGYRMGLAVVRVLVVVILLMMLGGLELVIDRTGLPYLVVMIDDSESMSIRDEPLPGQANSEERAPRLSRVKEWLASSQEQLRELTRRHKIQIYSHSTIPRLVGTYIDAKEIDQLMTSIQAIEPKGPESRIGGNLRTVLNRLRGTPPSAVVLVTDGVVTQGETIEQSAQYASRKNIPIYTVGVGDPGEVRDWEVRDLLVDETVFVGDLVTFQVKVASRGLAGESTKIRLVRKGSSEPVDEKTLTASSSGDLSVVELSFRPTEPGAEEYEVEIPVDRREIVKDNNKVERRIEAIKEKIKVLFVESYPRYEFRFLKNLLEREETVEVSVLLADADPEYLEEDRVAVGYFPTTREELFAYDVVILGDVSPSLLSNVQLENLREFVRGKGGGLLFVAGPEFNPLSYRDTVLEELLPVEIPGPLGTGAGSNTYDSFRPRLTVEGRASPIFRFGEDESSSVAILDSLPGAYWHSPIERAKPAAVVLAEHPTLQVDGKGVPLVATQFFGAGRTIFQGFTGTWRWRYRVEDLYFARYWIQSVRLLSRAKLLGKGRAVDMLVDRRKYRRGESVQLVVRLLDESLASRSDGGVSVVIERTDGTSRPVVLARRPDAPTVYEGVFGDTEDGTYRVRLTSPMVEGIEPIEFTVVPPPGELDRVRMNEPELKLVAETTRGAYYSLSEADALFGKLPPGRRVALHTDPPIELWNRWPVIVLLVGLLATEWVLRKRRSMI